MFGMLITLSPSENDAAGSTCVASPIRAGGPAIANRRVSDKVRAENPAAHRWTKFRMGTA
jgi:hypothetical protein